MAVGFPLKTTYANGDVYSASDVNDTNGTVNLLTGTQSAAGKNAVINGGFDIWQRGTSIAVPASDPNEYTADRWAIVTGANVASTVSRQVTGDTTNLPNIQYCGRFQRNSGQTGTAVMYISNAFETVNSIPFVGQQVTLSFYARRGANFSSASNVLTSKLYFGTGTDQQSNTGYTGATAVINQNNTLTTTWQRFTATGTVGTTANELSIEFSFTPSGTAGVNDYFEITGVQLEKSSSASAFARNGATIESELAACQRYYQRLDAANNSAQMAIGPAWAFNANGADMVYKFPVEMRVAPTTLDYSSLSHFQWQGITTNSVPTSIVYDTNINSRYNAGVTFNKTSGYTSGGNYFILVNSSSAYIGFGAEL